MKKTLFISLSLIVILMLYFGLTSKGYNPTNALSRNGSTITFSENSIALSDPGYSLPNPEAPFYLEMTIRPDYLTQPYFQFLFLIYNGHIDEQLLIGQWDRQLVIMNGNDYSNSKKAPKLYITLPLKNDTVKIIIKSNIETGTEVFFDDQIIRQSKNLILKIPAETKKSRLILGNNPNNTHPWTGTIYDMKVQNKSPTLLFPKRIPILRKDFLQWPDLREGGKANMSYDIMINIIGFIPLGFILPLIYRLVASLKSKKSLLLSLLSIFLFSLFLETLQIFIPLRDSSLLDLILNTLGGTLGIAISRPLYQHHLHLK